MPVLIPSNVPRPSDVPQNPAVNPATYATPVGTSPSPYRSGNTANPYSPPASTANPYSPPANSGDPTL